MNKNKKTFSIEKQNNRRKLVVFLSVLVLLLGSGVAAAYFAKVGPFTENNTSEDVNVVNLDEPTDEQIEEGNEAKKDTIDNDQAEGKPDTGSDPLPQPEPVDGSSKESVQAEITAANQTESELIVRTLIKTITNTGTCTIKISNTDAEAYTATADVQALPNGTTCKGFNVPLDQLAKGSHRIDITFSNDNLIATTSKTVTVE